jgi:N6-adenosine-specific RNA methylase IME4
MCSAIFYITTGEKNMSVDFDNDSASENDVDPFDICTRTATIPESWLDAAAKLKPSAFITGTFVWLHYEMNNGEPVPFSPSTGTQHGLTRDTVRHGLRALEGAGLLEITREPCKAAIVRPRWAHLESTDRHGRYVLELADLQEAIAQGRTARFACLLADPPWRYRNGGTRGSAQKHYPCMDVEQIAALPIADLMAPKSLCWLWTTTSFRREADHIMKSWGFTYKSEIVWNKKRMGLGSYARVQHEVLLIGSRGGQTTLTKSLRSVVEAKPLKHSQKPAVFRELVERNSPGPRLELFARGSAPGWVAYGNEPGSMGTRFAL